MDLPAPMLPTPGQLPTGPGWAHEFKWDGVRAMCEIRDGRLRMLTRGGSDVAGRFPELARIVETVRDVILDGEIVVFTGQLPDWSATMRRLRARRSGAAEPAATALVFDVLRLDGVDLRRRPYSERRGILDGLSLASGWVVPPVFSDGPATAAASLAHGLEGVVAKRLSSPYVSGRSRYWIKSRHKAVVDATVIGLVRRESGGVSLLLAEATSGGLVYVGRCTAPRGVVAALEPFAVSKPSVDVPDAPRGVRWVRPEVQVEVTAASRAPDGRLRQPRFVRLRMDQFG